MPPKKSNGFDFLEAAKDLVPTETLELEELGVTVTLRGLTQGEINKAFKRATKPAPKGKEPETDNDLLSALLFGASLYGQDGERLIPEGREHELANLPAGLWNKINQAVNRINGMGGDAEKNSDSTEGGPSPSV